MLRSNALASIVLTLVLPLEVVVSVALAEDDFKKLLDEETEAGLAKSWLLPPAPYPVPPTEPGP